MTCVFHLFEINLQAVVTVVLRNFQTLQLTHQLLGEGDHSVEATNRKAIQKGKKDMRCSRGGARLIGH